MDPDSQRSLENLEKLTKENNVMLRQLIRSLWWGRLWTAIKWTIVIVSTAGLYYYLQDIIVQGLSVYQKPLELLKNFDWSALEQGAGSVIGK